MAANGDEMSPSHKKSWKKVITGIFFEDAEHFDLIVRKVLIFLENIEEKPVNMYFILVPLHII